MSQKSIVMTAMLLAVTGTVAFITGRALATGAPAQTPLTYAGVVTDQAGKPYANSIDVTVSFYDAANAGGLKCKSQTVQAEAGTGRFSVVLPATCADAVHSTPDLWSEMAVGANQSILPRTHVGAMPYALEADSAKVATQATAAMGDLKATIDALKADVVALKAAPGGGGGPYVVDANGVKLGKLVGEVHHIQSEDLSRHPNGFSLITSTGYRVQISPDGNYVNELKFGNQLGFSTVDCKGTVAMEIGKPSDGLVANKLAYYFPGKGFCARGRCGQLQRREVFGV